MLKKSKTDRNDQSKKRKRIINILNLLLYFSAFKLLDLQSALLLIYIAIAIYYLIKYFRSNILIISGKTALLFSFFGLYCVSFFCFYGYNYSILRTAIFSVLLYYIGSKLIFCIYNPELQYRKTILIIGIGMAAYGTLSYFVSYTGKVLTTMNVKDRYVADFWNGLTIPPTNFNTNFLILSAVTAYSLFILNKWYKIIPLILTLSGILVAFGTATRTNLLMLALSFVLLFAYQIMYEKKGVEIKMLKITNKNLAFLTIMLGVFAFIILKWGDLFVSLIENLYASLFYRISNYVDISNDPRWYSWGNAFMGLFKFPFGNNTDMIMEAHNLALEVGRRTGIIPFLLLFIFIIKVTKNAFRLAKTKCYDKKTRILGFIVTLGTMVAMMIEPVFLGRPFIFIYLSLVWGMTNGLLKLSQVNMIT